MAAQNAFELITLDGVLKDKPATDRFTYYALPAGPNGEPYRDETDRHLQMMELNMATENRQFQMVIRKSEILLQQQTGHHMTGPEDPILAHVSPESAERYRVFWNYLYLQQRVIMDLPVSEPELQEAKRQVDEFYEKWYPLGRY